jgi:hypothetical protein
MAELTAQELMRRQTSSLFERGVDPYNTADTIRVSLELAVDFAIWVSSPPVVADGLEGDGHLRQHQAG